MCVACRVVLHRTSDDNFLVLHERWKLKDCNYFIFFYSFFFISLLFYSFIVFLNLLFLLFFYCLLFYFYLVCFFQFYFFILLFNLTFFIKFFIYTVIIGYFYIFLVSRADFFIASALIVCGFAEFMRLKLYDFLGFPTEKAMKLEKLSSENLRLKS